MQSITEKGHGLRLHREKRKFHWQMLEYSTITVKTIFVNDSHINMLTIYIYSKYELATVCH